jgi:pimeloyl-ACP methyl ester carboxylesterase
MVSIIHLHGFASSPGSTKAQFFKERFAPFGISLRIPDLNVPDFAHLTLTAMIEKAATEVITCPTGPVHLIGSSMGGAVALHLLDRNPQVAMRVEKLVLLAPGLDFLASRQRQLGDEGLKKWQETGWLDVQHYADGKVHQLHYGLLFDLARYNAFNVTVHTPMMLIHGRQDAVVDYTQSVRFAQSRPNVSLHLIDADHALTDALPQITAMIMDFLDLKATP